ncbi:hypothetical protein [Bradyrhizobium sp. NP1]|uniref:hypothetical protein n=1 Tax=Bradyrhizobium sp. NP1 TaxID=3049772 RepID=UPI0025A4F65A|nr:hypothetical protein [Bradyrhizobium sp. NP1]WJR75814.1 hypothetical protein QOU61_23910 [Bradyrhizobium sp. NP1]
MKLLRAPIRIPAFREALQWPASFHKDPALARLREIATEVVSKFDQSPAAQMKVG